MGEHALRHASVKGAQQVHGASRSQPLGQRGETTDVGEQHAGLLAADRGQGIVAVGKLLDHARRDIAGEIGALACRHGLLVHQGAGAGSAVGQDRRNQQQHEDTHDGVVEVDIGGREIALQADRVRDVAPDACHAYDRARCTGDQHGAAAPDGGEHEPRPEDEQWPEAERRERGYGHRVQE